VSYLMTFSNVMTNVIRALRLVQVFIGVNNVN